jgi:hypothetical protein
LLIFYQREIWNKVLKNVDRPDKYYKFNTGCKLIVERKLRFKGGMFMEHDLEFAVDTDIDFGFIGNFLMGDDFIKSH